VQIQIGQLLNLPDIQVPNVEITEHEIKGTTHYSHYIMERCETDGDIARSGDG
jgi:hypothetical protein